MGRQFTVGVVALMLIYSSAAFAGKPIPATGSTPEEAMEAAHKAVEIAARNKRTCVSAYPDLKKCFQRGDGLWECAGIRANKKSSCK